MPVNRAPTIDDLISQAQGKMQNTSSLLRYVLLAESLKIWVPCDDSSSDDSSSDDSSSEDSWSDDSSTDDGAGFGTCCFWRWSRGRPGPSGFQDDSSEEDDGDV
ncbi:hypothetical protein MRX96_046284 [Rhipicephalus microplus]